MRAFAARCSWELNQAIMPTEIKAVIFDYGATLDTGGDHWSRVIYNAYRSAGVDIPQDRFIEAYIYAERVIGPLIESTQTFREILEAKIGVQVQFLGLTLTVDSNDIARRCYQAALNHCYESAKTIRSINKDVKRGLVSNFYGNLDAVLSEMGMGGLFDVVVDSGVVNVRKPDPAIFQLAIQALDVAPSETLVIGDSVEKDMIPARSLGCHVIRIDGLPWFGASGNNSEFTSVSDIKSALSLFNLQ